MKKLFTPFAVLLWFVSRMWIIHFVPSYVSDVPLYHWLATEHVWNGKKLYIDHAFAYPPLAMPFVLWPAHLSRNISLEMYRYCFQWTIFFLEAGTLFLLLRFARTRLGLDDKARALAVSLFTVFGLLQCHLIYDRMDMGVGLLLLGALFLWEKPLALSILWACIGNLFKIIPAIFFSFPLTEKLLRSFSSRGVITRWTLRACAFVASYVPVVGVPILLEHWFFPGMSASLVEHLRRGIQIESVWAMPHMLWKAVFPKALIHIDMYFGAHEILGALVTPGYMLLAKSTGFLLLGLVFLHFFVRVGEKVSDDRYRMHAVLSFVLLFLASQRVLSPQFFIWLMPFAALWVAQKRSWRIACAFLGIYALTYLSFDVGFVAIVNSKLPWVTVLALRNLLTMAVAGVTIFRFMEERLLGIEPAVVRGLESPQLPRQVA